MRKVIAVLPLIVLIGLRPPAYAGLYERIIGTEEPKIAVHSFMAALGEMERGKITAGTLATAFSLSAAEQTEAATLFNRIVTPLESVSLGGFATLTNMGATYDTTTTVFASLGLGWCRIQTAGITGVEFSVSVNKIGSGTQSWQLWNETDGTEIAVIDDAGVAGLKTLSVTVSLPGPLAAALKTLRVRAKSTIAADDPIYLGAALMIRRIDRLTSVELHEVLLLAEHGEAYTVVGALKARLGVP